jgi:hypothetical protein
LFCHGLFGAPLRPSFWLGLVCVYNIRSSPRRAAANHSPSIGIFNTLRPITAPQ